MLDLQLKVNELQVYIDNILRFNATQRAVCAIKRHEPSQDTFTLRVTKTTLALQIGIELETLSRNLKKLPLYGAQINNKRVAIDRDTTRRTVCNHCAAKDWCKAY